MRDIGGKIRSLGLEACLAPEGLKRKTRLAVGWRFWHTPPSPGPNRSIRPFLQGRGAEMTSASLLIVLIVGTIVGALTGLTLGGLVGELWLTILAGLLATIIGALARNVIMVRGPGVGPDDLRTPLPVIVYSAVASLAGSSTAIEVERLSEVSAPAWLGTLAGLFSSILLAMLMITYHTTPGQTPRLKR